MAFLVIVFFPQLIALLAIVKFKELARRVLVFLNIFFSLMIVFRVLLVRQPIDFSIVFSFLVSILIILFYNHPKIRSQFRSQMTVPSEARKRILIVDDDKGLLKVIKAHLLNNGYNVDAVTTGEKGLQLAARKKPDLIILDVLLPGIKGREVCIHLKEDPETKEIPVLFLTAKDSPDDVKAEMKVGAIVHLTKPVNLRVLLGEIRKILGT